MSADNVIVGAIVTKAVLQRIVSASFLFLASTASAVYAQSVSVPFPEGFIGTVGSSRNSATNIQTFSTLEVDRAQFIQPSTTGLFTMQGNDIPGTLRLVFDDGTVIDVPGAVNWRDAQGSTLNAFGFIPDPLNPPRTISYGSSNQFTMTLNGSSNYGLRVIGSSQNYATVTSVSGNAATNGLLDALNTYLGTINTNGPKITGPSGLIGDPASVKTVDEGQTPVTRMVADRAVTWSIISGTEMAAFSIDAATGAITFRAPPDFERPTDSDTNNSYAVTILATDINGYTAQQTVTVTVRDLDDTAPVIAGPSGAPGAAASAVAVDEGTTAVAALTAGEPVAWALAGGADAALFAIDPATGALGFRAAPDYETRADQGADNVYDLVVEATDAHGNTSRQSVAVTVRDLDEAAPVIAGPTTISVPENQTAVTIYSADEPVTWSLEGGADLARFAIDPATGALGFRADPDHETPADQNGDNVHDVVIGAADSTGHTTQRTLAVTVTDLDEAALPEDTTPPDVVGPSGTEQEQTKTIDEGETLVATFDANEEVIWSVGGGADRATFTIDAVTGELRFVRPPNFRVPTDADLDNVYIVSVVAVDAAGNRTEITIAVTVADTGAPVITGPSRGAGATSSATSVDEGMTTVANMSADEAVNWAISGGPDSGRFAIDPVTGALRFVAPPDFEAPGDHDVNNSYVVTVTATDAQGNTSQQTVTVQVRDLSDTPTELFEEREGEVVAIIKDVEENHLRAAVATHQDMIRNARDRFIEGQRRQALCNDLDDPNQPVTSAMRESEECSPLATRNDVAFDIDGQIEAGSNGIFGAGTFFGQAGSFDGTSRRLIEGEFQLLDDGEGIETFDVAGRMAWERLVAEDLLLGAFVDGSAARSDVDRALHGAVDKASLSFGTYVVAEPVDNLYVDGFLSLAAGRNDLALSDDRLALDGEYTTRSLLVGGAVSGVIERERFEIRPELSLAYGATSFGDLRLDATAFGMTEEVTATIDGVDYATLRLTPEILVPLQSLSDDATLVVAPSLACEWTDSDKDCGGGLRIGLRGTSQDGMTGWSVSVATDRIGDTTRTGVEASVEHKF